MLYLPLILIVFLVSCSWRYQSIYPEHKRMVLDLENAKGTHTVGFIDDNSTFVFGRIQVFDKGPNRDITRNCRIVGLSNKYIKMSGHGAQPSDPKNDSLFYNINPKSNIHAATGLFAVHAQEGPVGVHYIRNNQKQNFDGGKLDCNLIGKNRDAELTFKSHIKTDYTKTYIGDFIVTFYARDAYTIEIKDNMKQTYADLIEVVPSAANKKVALEKSLAEKY